MSNLYQFESAADHLPEFLEEAYALAKAVKDDPVDARHIEPVLGLAGCVNKAVNAANVGPFGASTDVPDDIDGCCDRIMQLCDTQREGYASGGALWVLLAPVLSRLLARLIDRVI